MGKRTKTIFNIKGLSDALGLSRSRIDALVREGRMVPDYKDSSAMPYWTEATVEHYKAVLQQPAKKGHPRQFD